jgi:hypothetical protein
MFHADLSADLSALAAALDAVASAAEKDKRMAFAMESLREAALATVGLEAAADAYAYRNGPDPAYASEADHDAATRHAYTRAIGHCGADLDVPAAAALFDHLRRAVAHLDAGRVREENEARIEAEHVAATLLAGPCGLQAMARATEVEAEAEAAREALTSLRLSLRFRARTADRASADRVTVPGNRD